jgi:hypothetical protein
MDQGFSSGENGKRVMSVNYAAAVIFTAVGLFYSPGYLLARNAPAASPSPPMKTIGVPSAAKPEIVPSQSGHQELKRSRPLMTQSGHEDRTTAAGGA